MAADEQVVEAPVAWKASAEIVAAAYGLSPDILLLETRGRGWRPPKISWDARKVVVWVCVALTGVDYAELGRAIGMHKDTVSSHCAAVRQQAEDDPDFERQLDAILCAAQFRLRLRPIAPLAGDASPAPAAIASIRDRVTSLHLHMNSVFAKAYAAMSDEAGSSDDGDNSTDDHATVIRSDENCSSDVEPGSSDRHAVVIDMPRRRVGSAA